MVLKFRAVFRGFVSASEGENLYLLTQIYLQNVVLYAKDWSPVRLMPDTEMVLHPSLFAMLCCQTKSGCRAKSHRYQKTAQLVDISVKCMQEFELCSHIDTPWAMWVCSVPSLKLCQVDSVVFCPFCPQIAGGFLSVMRCVLLCCRACNARCFTLKWPWLLLTGTLNSCWCK